MFVSQLMSLFLNHLLKIYNAIVLFTLKLSGQTIFKFNVYFMHIDQLLYTNVNEHLIEDYEILMIDAMMRL